MIPILVHLLSKIARLGLQLSITGGFLIRIKKAAAKNLCICATLIAILAVLCQQAVVYTLRNAQSYIHQHPFQKEEDWYTCPLLRWVIMRATQFTYNWVAFKKGEPDESALLQR
jgi:hypothetical protein